MPHCGSPFANDGVMCGLECLGSCCTLQKVPCVLLIPAPLSGSVELHAGRMGVWGVQTEEEGSGDGWKEEEQG